MNIPRLSIGLPVYNGEPYLTESLDSLLGQSYTDFELIISDNASTDDTEGVCRRYAAMDPRIRYIRQPSNIGAAGNHNFVFEQARGELFKWAADDDLYGRDLLRLCIEALDEHPDVVLAHAWSAMMDPGTAEVARALVYPLATGSPEITVRFRSLLFDDGGDDDYGVIRSDVLRRTHLYDSYWHADRTIVTELALYGPFHHVPEWLYYRRDHAGRTSHAPSVRQWCTNYDARRADPLRHPVIRLLAEYVGGYVKALRRSPLPRLDRWRCYGLLLRWVASRALPGGRRWIEPTTTHASTAHIVPVVTGGIAGLDTADAGPERAGR